MHVLVEKVFVLIYVHNVEKTKAKISNSSNEGLQRELQLPPPKSNEWESVCNFLRSSWFQRAWIFQELMVTRRAEIRYGSSIIQCDDTNSLNSTKFTLSFQELIYAIQELDNRKVPDALSAPFALGPGQSHAFMRIDGWYRQKNNVLPNSHNLLSLMRRRRGCGASDPRDKVYALLNVASDKDQLALFPDYTISRLHYFLSRDLHTCSSCHHQSR
jgi:hypothetical protein